MDNVEGYICDCAECNGTTIQGPSSDDVQIQTLPIADDIIEDLPIHEDHEFHIVDDMIAQLDGALNSSSEDSEFEYDIVQASLRRVNNKRQRIESDGSSSEDPNYDNDLETAPVDNEGLNEDDHVSLTPPSSFHIEPSIEGNNESVNLELVTSSLKVPKNKVILKDGRKLLAIPNTGKSFILNKSHRTYPSNIWRHVNDIITISKVEVSLSQKPVMCMCLDDGADWGGRSQLIPFYLGRLWMVLDLDLPIIVRNAPGDSRWNCIER